MYDGGWTKINNQALVASSLAAMMLLMRIPGEHEIKFRRVVLGQK
jgi:hypothetical protein